MDPVLNTPIKQESADPQAHKKRVEQELREAGLGWFVRYVEMRRLESEDT
jgi:hypothetical protein